MQARDQEATCVEPRPSQVELEIILARLGRGGRWLRTIFLLGCLPGVLNAMHLASYVFMAMEPEHWCAIPQMQRSGWTSEQVRNISSPNFTRSCAYLEWNYTELSSLSYDTALEYTRTSPLPPAQPCSAHIFIETQPGSSIVSEWSLVCQHAALRTTAQVVLAVGKILGSLLFGCIADRMGRKTSFVAASLVYLVAGPAAAFSFHFSAFLFFRAALGAAASGTFNAAYTILTEAADPSKRPNLGILFNLSYPIGYLALPVIALAIHNWRPLQLAISLPALLLVLSCWFLPESPRWLLTQGRVREALHVVRHASPGSTVIRRNSVLRLATQEPEQEHTACWAGIGGFLHRIFALLRELELRRRLFLIQACWFSCAFTYHTLGLSAASLLLQPHRYVALMGAVEIPAYLIPLLMMPRVGRKSGISMLLIGSAASLLSLLAIPPEWSMGVLGAALLGRLCSSAAYSVVVLFTTELFPTESRSTAIGMCTTMAQLASIFAPYSVDLLGAHNTSIPHAICGVLSAFASILVLGLPETHDLPLFDTVEQSARPSLFLPSLRGVVGESRLSVPISSCAAQDSPHPDDQSPFTSVQLQDIQYIDDMKLP